jgi:DNA-binding HxlR family transcriptional regulator
MAYRRKALAPDAFLRMCPSRLVMARIGEKWTLMSVVALADGPLRFGELLHRLDGVSQKMLSQSLRALERDGLVDRKAFDVVPLRVDYSLTASGRTLLPLVHALKSWAETHLHEIESSNRRHDLRPKAGLRPSSPS